MEDESRWVENNLSQDILSEFRHQIKFSRIAAVCTFIVLISIAFFFYYIGKRTPIIGVGLVSMVAVIGFFILWYTNDLKLKYTPKKLKWGKEGIEYITRNGKYRFVSWKNIYSIEPSPQYDDWGIYFGTNGYAVNEEIGKELKKAWERWQDEQAEIKAREWEEKKNRKARKKWWM